MSGEGLAEAIASLVTLAKDSAGAVEFVVSKQEGMTGFPENIAFFQKTGPMPSLTSAKGLIDEWRTAPERIKGKASVTTLRAFIDLVNRHKDAGTAIFAKTVWPSLSLLAVVDYHGIDHAPRFGQHRIEYSFPITKELSAWIDENDKEMDQADFAEFIEERVMDLAAPTDTEQQSLEKLFRAKFANPADLVELSRGLEINVESKVKNSVKLQSGEATITFETTHKDGAGQEVHVPGLFMVQLRAFLDGDPVRLAARLRYKVKGGAVVWRYQLYQWQDALRERVAADLELVANATALPTFEGSPEA